jgi:hypothetical protein
VIAQAVVVVVIATAVKSALCTLLLVPVVATRLWCLSSLVRTALFIAAIAISHALPVVVVIVDRAGNTDE